MNLVTEYQDTALALIYHHLRRGFLITYPDGRLTAHYGLEVDARFPLEVCRQAIVASKTPPIKN